MSTFNRETNTFTVVFGSNPVELDRLFPIVHGCLYVENLYTSDDALRNRIHAAMNSGVWCHDISEAFEETCTSTNLPSLVWSWLGRTTTAVGPIHALAVEVLLKDTPYNYVVVKSE